MKKSSILFVALFIVSHVHAQQLPSSSQYLINPYSLSPTWAGSWDAASLFIGYRNERLNFPGSAITNFFSLDAPLSSNVSVGGSLIYDQSDIFRHIYSTLSYTYRLKFNEFHRLNLSLYGGLYENSMDFSETELEFIVNDPVVADKMNKRGVGINSGAGVLYHFKKLGIGIDVLNLVESKLNYKTASNEEAYNLRRTFQSHVTYPFAVNDNWQITPFLINHYTMNSPFQWEFATMFKYKKNYWLAGSINKGMEVGISGGAKVNNNIIINYTFEFSNSDFGSYNNGTHQFGFGFIFGGKQLSRDRIDDQGYTRVGSQKTKASSVKNSELESKIDSMQLTINKLTKEMNTGYQQDLQNMEEEIKKMKLEMEKMASELSEKQEKEVIAEKQQTEVESEDVSVKKDIQVSDDKGYYLVLDSYTKIEQAENGMQIWTDRGYNCGVVYKSETGWYHVYSDKYENLEDAMKSLKEHRAKELDDVWILIIK
ncbi:PorP/SprF family type IX secretion system membrane protein [Bacteroidota bacterium]